jgi:hypothetical protein
LIVVVVAVPRRDPSSDEDAGAEAACCCGAIGPSTELHPNAVMAIAAVATNPRNERTRSI